MRYQKLKEKLEGCFYTIFTPFDEDYKIDFEGLRKYIEFLYSGGARKFYVMAYNSRYSQLEFDEILALNEYCIKIVKELDSSNIIIVGDPIHCSTETSLKFAVHAKKCGADMISLIVREKYFTEDQILDHFQYVGEKSDFPILVHEMPFLSGMNGKQMDWPFSLIKKLKGNPYIVAIKEDAKNFEITKQVLSLEPDIKVVIAGVKKKFIEFKPFGARAYLNGISLIDARIGEEFWKSWEANDMDRIKEIIEKLEDPFFDTVVKKYGWHRCNKALIQCLGIFHRRDRMPMPHLNEEEFKEVQNVFKTIQENLKIIN